MSNDFMLSMNTNSRIMRLQNAFRQRLASGDLTTKRDLSSLQPITDIEQEDQGRLQQIHAKLQYGGTLTEKERNYLKAKDPKAYADLVREEEEQKSYERSLRLCKTQEDVQNLKFSRITRALDKMKATERDSSLTKEEKLKIASGILRNLRDINKSTDQFVHSTAFKRLPCCAAHSSTSFSTEEKLRSLLTERMEKMIGRSSKQSSSHFDTFVRSDTFEENMEEATASIQKLYEEVQNTWQNSITTSMAKRI